MWSASWPRPQVQTLLIKLDEMVVVVVDDFQSYRAFVVSELQKRKESQVIYEAPDGVEAVPLAKEHQPDLILLDIGLPKLNGIEAARQIREVTPNSKILFVSQEKSHRRSTRSSRHWTGLFGEGRWGPFVCR